MFETFNVPSLYIASKAVLSLFSFGRTTGFSLTQGITKLDFASSDLTGLMMKFLTSNGCAFSKAEEKKKIVC